MTLREYCSFANVSNVCTQGPFTMADLKRVALVCDGCFSRFTFITMLTKASVIHGFVCADLGTEHDWVVQEVVVPDVPSGLCSYPSCSTKERMYNPLKVEHWDVKGEIEEFFKRADKRKRAYEISVTSSTRKTSVTAKMEGTIVANIMSEMQHFMEKKQPQLTFRFESQVVLSFIEKKKDKTDETDETDKADKKDEADKTGSDATFSPKLVDLMIRNPRADFVVTIQEKNALVVEVKNGGLGPDQGDPWHLHKAWTECSCIPGEGDPNCRCEVLGITAAHGEKLIRCISQLYEYMALSEVGYGVLTDARNWYLFKRDNAGCLKISIGFKAGGGHPPVLAALTYLVDIACKDNSKFDKGPRHGETPRVHGAAPSDSSSESTDDVKNDPDFRGCGSSNSVSKTTRSTRTCSDGNQLTLKDVSAVDLNLKVTGGIISCEGWSGCVAIGRMYGQAVALKFAYLNTERAEALLKEVVAYQKMKKLWGIFVPRLIEYGTTCNGQAVFVATELIDGVELGEVAVTQEVETAALDALDAVHACGLLHGDIEARNIMVVRGKQPPVRILDFGFSRVTSSKKLQEAERVRLEYLLAHMMK
uniref:Protein kinase domain-containing protein n=1 Tax=Physcomitrium patens TaxID=3218 RepID=A0A7I4E818_PHYPA